MSALRPDTKHLPADTSTSDPLGEQLLKYGKDVDDLNTAADVLDRLHDITWQFCRLSVLGAVLLPLRWSELDGTEKGKTVFLHKSAPYGWWEEYLQMLHKDLDPGVLMAQLSLESLTWTESRRKLEPLGVDRWPHELALKHGMRDGLQCVVGGRWLVAYWSRRVLSDSLTQQNRALLFLGARFAAIRLQRLIGPQVRRIGEKRSLLTPRDSGIASVVGRKAHARGRKPPRTGGRDHTQSPEEG
jgi:hypothetical protein